MNPMSRLSSGAGLLGLATTPVNNGPSATSMATSNPKSFRPPPMAANGGGYHTTNTTMAATVATAKLTSKWTPAARMRRFMAISQAENVFVLRLLQRLRVLLTREKGRLGALFCLERVTYLHSAGAKRGFKLPATAPARPRLAAATLVVDEHAQSTEPVAPAAAVDSVVMVPAALR